jgi:hypothetical protein
VARKRKEAGDKRQFVSPPFIPPGESEAVAWNGDHQIPTFAVDYLAKRAAYVGKFHEVYDDDRLNWLINIDEPLSAKTIGEWNELMGIYYPPHPLTPGENPHAHTSDAKVKAHFLERALSHLLELTGCPRIVISDLMILLDGYPIREAVAYAKAQRELLLDKSAHYTQIGERSGVDQSEISQAVQAGHLIDPWAKGRS